MFNFLNPIILIAAGVAVLFPLLIHIFNRQKVKKILFSSLLFLRSLEKTRMRRVKIKEYLLLIIRSLIILLAVAAFARPAIKGSFGSRMGSHAKTSIVVLLDNSYSLGYETKDGPIFKTAKEKAKQVLSQLQEGDEASLILFNSRPHLITPQPTYDFKHLAESLDEEVKISAGTTDIGSALDKGYQLLKNSKNLNKEIYLITDMEKSGWSTLQAGSISMENKKVKLYVVDVSPADRQNLCIEKVEFGNQLIEPAKPFQLSAQIENFTLQPVNKFLVGLYLDGKRVSQTDTDIEKGGKSTVKFNAVVEQAGIHTGFFELTDDDLMIDNRRYFTFRIPEKMKVLLVGETVRDTRYLSLALNPLNSSDAAKEVTSVSKDDLPGVDFNQYRVIFFSNLSRLSDIQLANLERFINRGGGAFFILGDKIDPEFYSQKILKLFFDLSVTAPLALTKSMSGFFSLENFDLDHPIFQVYQQVEKDKLPEIKFFSIFPLPEGGNTKTLARFNSGKPAFLENNFGSGKVMLSAAPLEESEGDLVIHPFFVPLVNRSVEYLGSDLSRLDEELLVDAKITRQLPADLAVTGIELVDPSMKRISLQPSFPAGGQSDQLMVRIEDTSLPGIYSILSKSSANEEEVVDRFAVNIDGRDSDPEKIERSDVDKKLEGLSVFYVSPQDDLEKSILQSRYGKELWKTFLWIALGLLAVEMFLSRSRKKDMVKEESS
jgi:hypothetical protein